MEDLKTEWPFQGGCSWRGAMGSELSTPGRILPRLFGTYERAAPRPATLENDFVVLKKVRVGISCFTRILSIHHAQSPVLG